jgi:hypothetical protein
MTGVGKADQRRRDKARADANAAERRRVALHVFHGCDGVIERELAALAAAGTTPTCAAGCSHCCSLDVPMSRPEGEALVAWLRDNRSADDIAAIRDRLRGWLAWYRTDYPRLVASGVSRPQAFFRHAPKCALNVDGLCSAYPARPIACRTHYVTSPVTECDPATGNGEPDTLDNVSRATAAHVVELRHVVEQQGGDYLASVHLIAEWLAHMLDVEREPWRGAPPAV